MRKNLEPLISAVRRSSRPLHEVRDLEPLVRRLGRARIVLLGEATHGTQEFYSWRRLISEWLIVKYGFKFIAVEGDWPPCQSITRYIQNRDSSQGLDPRNALSVFHRWPTWMWANTEIVRMVEWLRERRVGFHGLDVYSLFESIDRVVEILEELNPFLARRARLRYACFDPYHRDEHGYARALLTLPKSCEEDAVQALRDLVSLRWNPPHETPQDAEAIFDARQNARIVRNAERYYRALVHADEDSWNVRDRHMLETLEILLQHYGSDSKAIVWAHNTHVGDYRATDMHAQGLVNLGGLVRERFGENETAILGFGTHEGKVIASHSWDGPIESLEVPPSHEGSWDAVMHEACKRDNAPAFFSVFNEDDRIGELSEWLKQRAIGVVYHPHYESRGNYVPTSLARRYDAFLFEDRTSAIDPLILSIDERDLPETWPVGI